MKNLGRSVMVMGIVAGGTSVATMVTMVGCGDNTIITDAGPDGTTDTGLDVKADTIGNDASDAGDANSDGPNAIAQFRTQVATGFCNHFQNCCNTIDAGPFNYAQCMQSATSSAWNGSNGELSTAEVIARGNVTLNSTAAASCLAGLSTLSCPAITSSEVNTVTANCFAAAIGTLGVGADCVASIECQPTEYCQFAGIDAGKTDAGSTLGQCATLIAQGQPCGQAPPYGAPAYTSEECEYKGWQPPAHFCDYDSFPDAGGYTCQPLRANSTPCFNDDECSSGICGTYGQDCIGTTCICSTTRDYTNFCLQLEIKDAGPG